MRCRRLSAITRVSIKGGAVLFPSFIKHRQSIAIGIVMLAMALGIATVIGFAYMVQLTENFSSKTAMAVIYNQAQIAVTEEESLERKYRLEPGPTALARFASARFRLLALLDQAAHQGGIEDQILRDEIVRDAAAYQQAVSRMFAAVDAGDTARVLEIDAGAVDPVFDLIAKKVALAAANHRETALASGVEFNRLYPALYFALVCSMGMPLLLVLIFRQTLKYESRLTQVRAENERQVRRHNSQLEETQRIGRIGGWTWDAATGAIICSAETCRIFEHEPDSSFTTLEGFLSSVHPLDLDTVKLAIQAASPDRRPFSIDHRIMLLNGEIRWVHAQGLVSFDASDQPTRIKATVQDITDSKQIMLALIQAKAEAEEASLAKSRFLARISHELRTPLNAILGFTQILDHADDRVTIGEERDTIKTVLNSGWNLLRIINDLLDFSAIEANKLEVNIVDVSLEEVVLESRKTIATLALKHQVTVALPTGVQGIFVKADKHRLQQVLLNLLSNAVKYNRANGTVQVTCGHSGDRIRIAVTDTGPGILQQDFPALFEAFSRLHQRAYDIEGAGIGLAISKQLTELMHGTLGVESVVGQGSTFWVELATGEVTASGQSLGTLPHEVVTHMSKRPKVLYIEDNPLHVMLMERIIRDMGNIELLVAHTPQLGLELARTDKPDLILSDIGLPGMNGFELLAQLKADHDTRDIPVVAVSAHAILTEVERGLNAGFVRYVTKPLHVAEITKMMKTLLAV